jgi:guanylate cyclase
MPRARRPYLPTGILETLEDPRVGERIMLTNVLLPPVLTSASVVGCAALGERSVAVVLSLFLAAQLVSLVVFLRTGRSRLVALIQIWALLVTSTVCHVLLGGYVWSGGSLLYGIAVVASAALLVDRRTANVLTLLCLAIAAVMVPLEPLLQARREQPSLALSLFVMIVLYLAILALVGRPAVVLVERLRLEQRRNRDLMLNVLPASIADRLKTSTGLIADRHPSCSVVFADLVGFTAHARERAPEVVVGELNAIVTRFDEIVAERGAQKIKTMGDGYLAVCGVPDPDPDHVRTACDVALALRDALPELNAGLGTGFQLRVGINTGGAVAGVIGTARFSYDVWGDTVNLASRLESAAIPGTIAVSADVARAVGDDYVVQPAGLRELKGEGAVEVFELFGRRTVDSP